MKRLFLLFFILIVLMSGLYGYYFFNLKETKFKNLNAEGKLARILEERDQAISEAVERGDYRCCINPPCTMCYTEGNKWNNYKAGTCACDDLIAQGKEACPQCERGEKDIYSEENIFCDKDAVLPACESIKKVN